MKLVNLLPVNKTKAVLSAFAILLIATLYSCSKSDGSLLAASKVNSVIQINANTTNYSLSSAPDVISFNTATVNSSTPNLREYVVKGINTTSSVSFALAFHIDSIGSGRYILEGSQLIISGKSYISFATKSTDRVNITKIDQINKLYTGTFSFWSYNQALATDSVLVTGAYSIQQ